MIWVLDWCLDSRLLRFRKFWNKSRFEITEAGVKI